MSRHFDVGRSVLLAEAAALQQAARRINPEFNTAVQIIRGTTGHVVCMGLGKSGLVARKIAATMSSVGIPAVFLHPVEAVHGDVGLLQPSDTVLFVSKSGSTEDVVKVLRYAKQIDIPIIALVGNLGSGLASFADACVDCSVASEACGMDLVPTCSTTVAMAVGDALSVAALTANGFTAEDFLALHPGGAIGRDAVLSYPGNPAYSAEPAEGV